MQHTAVLSHPPPWGRSGRAPSRSIRSSTFSTIRATIPIALAPTRRCLYAVDLLEAAVGDLGGHDVVVLGAAYRGGVRRRSAGRPGRRVGGPGKRPLVHDPLFSDDELRAIGLERCGGCCADRFDRSGRAEPIAILAHSTSESVWSLTAQLGEGGSGRDPTGHHRTGGRVDARARRLEAWEYRMIRIVDSASRWARNDR